MHRPALLFLSALCSSALLLGAASTVPGAAARTTAVAPTPGHPNVVLVMTDDMALSDLRWMPRTRKMVGRRGVTFREGLSPNALCCPARATVLTGQESHNNGVWGNKGPRGGYSALSAGTSRLPQWLQAAGYRTAFLGKHLNGFNLSNAPQEQGWNVLDALVRGVYNYRYFTTWDDGRLHRERDGYVTEHLARRTRRVLDRFERFERADEKPFFLWVSHVAPHAASVRRCAKAPCWVPPVPARRDLGDFAGVPSPSRAVPSWNHANGADKPPFLRDLGRVQRTALDARFQRRIESLQAVDRSVARLVRDLRERGELDDTVLVFTSDNGFSMGQHRYVGKRLPYEETVRVPLLVRGPDIRVGTRSGRPATTADISRTIVELAGATPPYPLDGLSLVPTLTGSGGEARGATILQTGAAFAGEGDGSGLGGEPSDLGWLFRGYRDERYTYARYPDPVGEATAAFEELYDRDRDPYQLHNVVADPEYASVLAQVRGRAAALGTCAGPACHPAWAPLPGPG